MLIKKQQHKALHIDAALKFDDHGIPRTRREFLSQGFMAGGATVMGSSVLSLFANPRSAQAALSADLETLKGVDFCNITNGAGRIPFICFDLAGGANIAGSNVLMGGQGGQMDFLSTAGYSKLGLPGDMVPGAVNPDDPVGNSFIDTDLGLAFHTDSPFLIGIKEKLAASRFANVDGSIIAARSENDTGNNPHNPMYGIFQTGSDGSLLSLIGSRSSDSGGNSMAPMEYMDPSVRPTKIDRPSDATGLVDVGDLTALLSEDDAVAVMEAIQRISDRKLGQVDTKISADDVVKELVSCGYVKSADLADRFSDPTTLNPEADPDIVGPGGIFSAEEFASEGEFRKTASVMKLVVNGYAGAGTITMGGFDYHTGERGTGEIRDLRAGRCMGACLEYAARMGQPLMMYVFSDGSVASNGRIDDTLEGRGKGEWTGDNQSTAASFFMVYSPTIVPPLLSNQIGWMRSDASVETASTPAANNVNQLVQTVLLNYMALHGEQSNFETLFPGHGLGTASQMDNLIGFGSII